MTHVRSLDLWDFVCWVYRDQKAHLYLREKANWFDWAIDMTTHGEIDVNVPVHYDAAMLHAAVIEMGFMPASLIVQQAMAGDRPEISSARPRPYPVKPSDGMLQADDRASWTSVENRRVNCIIRSEEKIQTTEIVQRRSKFKSKGHTTEERVAFVPVEFCPVEWSPSPAFTEMVNSIYQEWAQAMILLMLKITDQRLKNHIVTGFEFEPAPSFDEPDYSAGQRPADTFAKIERLDGFSEGVSWKKDGNGLTPIPWRYKRVLRTTVVNPPKLRHEPPYVVALAS